MGSADSFDTETPTETEPNRLGGRTAEQGDGSTSSYPTIGAGRRISGGGLAGDWRRVIDEFLDVQHDRLVAIRRHFHAHPEPSREEYQTSQAIARMLDEAGIPQRIPPTGRGVIAGPEPADPGDSRLVALRADIDALRIIDEKDVPYRSAREGFMHACGHDAHTTMVLGASLALKHLGDTLRVPTLWRAIFQPAEEEGQGAAEMVGAGAMEGVAAILALHVDPDREVGHIGVRRGPLTASCSEFHVVLHGRGGHAARPHQAIEAIPAAAQLITAVHTWAPRAFDAREPVVVTFGAITGGAQGNVIPERVILRGTIRTLSRLVSLRVEERLRAIAESVAAMTGTRIEVSFLQGPDAVVNDPSVTEVAALAAAEVVGPGGVQEIEKPSLGGEDFSAYLPHAPGCLLRLGVAPRGARDWPMLHSPRFDIDENALVLGSKLLARAAVMLSRGLDSVPPRPGTVG